MQIVAEPTLTDEDLVQKFINGNEDSFTELVTRHKAWIIAKATHYSRDFSEADDIAQNIFIKAHRHIQSFNFKSPFRHWLSRIATNVCYDYLRKRRAHAWLSFLPQHSSRSDTPVLPDLPQNESPHSEHPLLLLLPKALERLSPQERIVITMQGFEEKSLAEISTLTGWSIANIKVRAHRARIKLKKILEIMTP